MRFANCKACCEFENWLPKGEFAWWFIDEESFWFKKFLVWKFSFKHTTSRSNPDSSPKQPDPASIVSIFKYPNWTHLDSKPKVMAVTDASRLRFRMNQRHHSITGALPLWTFGTRCFDRESIPQSILMTGQGKLFELLMNTSETGSTGPALASSCLQFASSSSLAIVFWFFRWIQCRRISICDFKLLEFFLVFCSMPLEEISDWFLNSRAADRKCA